MRSPHTATKSSPHSPQLEKAAHSNEDPAKPKTIKKKERKRRREKKKKVRNGREKKSLNLSVQCAFTQCLPHTDEILKKKKRKEKKWSMLPIHVDK